MTKSDFIEGGIIILGLGLVAWGAIYLAVNAIAWICCVAVGNPKTVALYFVADFIRAILANVLQCAVGCFVVAKNRQIAAYVNKLGQEVE
jgi:hypothetical protein